MIKRFSIIAALTGCVHNEMPVQNLVKLQSGPIHFVIPDQTPVLEFRGVRHDLVTLTSGGKSFLAEGLISSDEKKLNIIVFSGTFGKLLQISIQNGEILYDVSSRLPPEFKPEFLLVDLLMIIGSDAELQNWLRGEFEISSDERTRKVIKNGQILSLLEKDATPGPSPTLAYQNRYFGYSLKIESIHDH